MAPRTVVAGPVLANLCSLPHRVALTQQRPWQPVVRILCSIAYLWTTLAVFGYPQKLFGVPWLILMGQRIRSLNGQRHQVLPWFYFVSMDLGV
jgi:hypothetical protein